MFRKRVGASLVDGGESPKSTSLCATTISSEPPPFFELGGGG
jgi:hypothetical protein